MSRSVHVELGERSYDIAIGRDLPVASLREGGQGGRVLLVSDSHVDALYGDRFAAMLTDYGLQVSRFAVPAGEASKSLGAVERLYEQAVEAGLDRHATIVALGGGVVGDLAGFAAATYLRGIAFVQIPTSLLAMVDSSVGGKTGVNLPRGKNLVGAFYQPIEVVADLGLLRTLPDKEYNAGLAEVVKYGMIWDATFFGELEGNVGAIQARDEAFLEGVVARCCEIKAEVVAVDERDAGVRAILNFGHTLGHALEQVSGYGKLLHGEAVAIGMVYAARLSCAEKAFPPEDLDRLVGLLARLGLPVRPDADVSAAGWGALRRAISADKKTVGRVPRFVLAERIGAVVYGHGVSEAMLESTFAELVGGS